MRKVIYISSIVFAILGIAFTVLPMGTIALLPIGITIALASTALYLSQDKKRLMPKIIILVASLSFLVVIGKDIFIKDEVKVDQQFEQKKVESQKEDMKDLEGL